MMTSRIVQANSSIQLFVQRCLTNLEAEVPPSAIDADQWHNWRKRYRFWEANRKVFLYPENWIYPELRDDKSPFFKELESQLLQNDLTDDAVEEAVLTYLEKLNQVKRLEICGMYWQNDVDPVTSMETNVLHVLGRTFNSPPLYYYRRWLVETKVWTAWELVSVNIEGDHLIPVVLNGYFVVFWAIFTKKSNTSTDDPKPPGESPAMHWEIQLAWSEYKHGKWSPKHMSRESISFDPNKFGLTSLPDQKYFLFRPVLSSTGLAIRALTTMQPFYSGQAGPSGSPLVYDYQIVGSYVFISNFWMNGCSELVEVTDKSLPPDTKDEISTSPSNAAESFMGFDQYESSSGLQLENWQLGSYPQVLQNTPTMYHLLYPDQVENTSLPTAFRSGFFPFFYRDDKREYFVRPIDMRPSKQALALAKATLDMMPAIGVCEPGQSCPKGLPSELGGSGQSYSVPGIEWEFVNFYHPHVCTFLQRVAEGGFPRMLSLATQRMDNDVRHGLGEKPTVFERTYTPNTSEVKPPYPTEDVDFSSDGAYSIYNWELFFHIPLLIATQLSKNQQFERAQEWFHYIFDPTDSSKEPAPQCYWKVLPFYRCTESERIEDSLKQVASGAANPENSDCQQDIRIQLTQWAQTPFNPHLIGRMRLIAYQKTVVMKYIDNLIGWGDQLFSQDTMESINEATQLYVLASQILGARPERIPTRPIPRSSTYRDLVNHGLGQDDPLSNPLVALENAFPLTDTAGSFSGVNSSVSDGLGLDVTFYFCIPKNDQLLAYWDTVADRLFKIRHCMNIEGVVRELPLFAPPIDPALLVRAAAMGIDLSSALNDINAATPCYRFTVIVQKAIDLCADVKAFGVALLGAIEKKDAEALAALRASQETDLLKAVRKTRQNQLEEAQTNVDALLKAKDVTNIRYGYYDSIPNRIPEETDQLNSMAGASQLQIASEHSQLSAANLGTFLPDITIGISGSPPAGMATVTAGNRQAMAHYEAESKQLGINASKQTYAASVASLLGVWSRRQADWSFQKSLAAQELEQIDRQIHAAGVRVAVAQSELDNHDLQIDSASAIEEFLRNKYSNQDLYGWMLSQTAGTFFQSYKLAYDLAKRAEQAYCFERGLTAAEYISFGYWDSLRKGLLSGEQLSLDLKRLEMAYLDQNKRDREITKHISLMLTDPMALISLKETGQCVTVLPEGLFDADYPGHYMRRLKSASLTIPCVTGPYTSVNCTLTLLKSSIRLKSSPAGSEGNYSRDIDSDDPRFVDNFGAVESICTSHAQNDSGMFELSFRDERYLPFEGAGAISTWRIEMPKDCNAFDFETISDLVLNLNYTARDGGKRLQDAARKALELSAWSPAKGGSGSSSSANLRCSA
jgi:hypothetical protein